MIWRTETTYIQAKIEHALQFLNNHTLNKKLKYICKHYISFS